MEWSHLIDSFLCILGIILLSALALASSTSLVFFYFESSGLYFLNSLNNTFANIKNILTAILLKGSRELSDSSWHFESSQEDSLLSLESNVFGPLHKPGQVSCRLDVISKSKVSWSLFEKRIGFFFNFLDSFFSFNPFTLKLEHILPLFFIGWL